MSDKSMNKLYKDSKTSLSFAEFCERENKKKEEKKFMTFTSNPSDVITGAIKSVDTTIKPPAATGLKTTESKNTVFGLDKRVVVFSGVLILAAAGYYIYTRTKK